MRSLILAIATIFIAGCSSSTKINGTSVPEDKVLSRIDGLSARPDWLKESEVFKVEKGIVYALGTTTLPEDSRVEAGYRIAENNAKSRLASTIEQRLDFVFQNAEEGTGMDSTQARFIGAEASKITTSAIRTSNVYWEKVLKHDSNGNASIVYKVFARSSIPESELKKAIKEAINARSGNKGISKAFSEKVDQHWDKFTSEQL